MQYFKDSFVCGNIIDVGPFCGCWEVMDRETGDFHYLKIIEKDQLETPKKTDNFSSEINLLGSLEFSTIPKLISFFTDESNFYVVFEKPEGESLLEFIGKNGKIDDSEFAKKFSISFIQTIQYLFTYVDPSIQWTISTETIFVKDDGSISQIFVIIKNSNLITLTNEISMKTTAPEVITHNKISPKCMPWFLGCELFFILNGYFPFEGNTVEEIKNNILYSHPIFLSQLSKDCFDFLKALLIKNPQMRISIEKAASMPFINQIEDHSKSFVKSLSADRILARKSISSSILFCDSFYSSSTLPENEEGVLISSEPECEAETDNSRNQNKVDPNREKKRKKRKKRKSENNILTSDESLNDKEQHFLKTNFSYSTDIPALSGHKKKPELHRNSSFFMLPNTENKIHLLTNDLHYQTKYPNINSFNNRSFSYFHDKTSRNKVPLTPRKFFSPLQSFNAKNFVNNEKSESL